MKKFLFFISLFVFFIVPVKADVTPGTITCSSTVNLLSSNYINNYRILSPTSGQPLSFSSRSKSYISDYTKINSSSSYTYHSTSTNTSGLSFYFVDSDFNYLSSINARVDLNSSNANLYSFESPSNTSYVIINWFANTLNNTLPTDWEIQLESGSSFTSYVPYSECTTPTPTPDESIYSNFLTLYIDRFNFLANGFTTNPYLLSMIGIILAWVVLELLLHLIHIKGGYKK